MVNIMQQVDDMLDPKKKKESQFGTESTLIDGGSAPTGAAQPTAPADYTKSSYQSPAKIMQANTQSNGVDLTGTYNDQASKIRTSLKSEKDENYTKLKDARVQPMDSGQVSAAVDGDDTAQNKVSNLLSSKFQKPTYSSSVSTDINDLDSLQNAGGIASLLRQRGNPNYTSGMANLDARLFQNNPMAGEQVNKARQIARDVRAEGQAQKTQFEKDVGQADSEWSNYIQSLRNDLTGRRQDIQNKIKEQTSSRKQSRNAGVSELDNVLNRVLSEGQGGQINPVLMDELNRVDRSPFVGTDFAGDVVDSTQARQLNNIQRLLGDGGTLFNENTGAFKAADSLGYEGALRSALGAYRDRVAAADAANKATTADPGLTQRQGQVANPSDSAPGEFRPIPGMPDLKNPTPTIPGTPAPISPNIPEARSPVADVRQPGGAVLPGGVAVNPSPVETVVSTATSGDVRTPTEILKDLLGQSPSKPGESNGMDALDTLSDFKPSFAPGSVDAMKPVFDVPKSMSSLDFGPMPQVTPLTPAQLAAQVKSQADYSTGMADLDAQRAKELEAEKKALRDMTETMNKLQGRPAPVKKLFGRY